MTALSSPEPTNTIRSTSALDIPTVLTDDPSQHSRELNDLIRQRISPLMRTFTERVADSERDLFLPPLHPRQQDEAMPAEDDLFFLPSSLALPLSRSLPYQGDRRE